MRKRSWSTSQLIQAVGSSRSIRQVLQKLHLVEAGGNYAQMKKYIHELALNTEHMTGRGWNRNLEFRPNKEIPLSEILIENMQYQSYKLKLRLFKTGLKIQKCEICGWSKTSSDGRLPLELHHINGNHSDNRIENLQILCPNCHSLEQGYRGRNKGRVAEW